MNTQALTNPVLCCNFAVVSPPVDFPRVHPIQACSRDYGFDSDEDEMGRELLAPLPANLSLQAIPEVDADEFDQVFQCFLS